MIGKVADGSFSRSLQVADPRLTKMAGGPLRSMSPSGVRCEPSAKQPRQDGTEVVAYCDSGRLGRLKRPEAFEFWDNLKKNTEQQGSIFGPRPFADYGNIRCLTDVSEPVLGYISACTIAQQRIYITGRDVQWPYSFPGCEDTTVIPNMIETVFSNPTYLPVSYVFVPPGAVFGSQADCVDCRLNGGGSTIKPPYMP